MAGPKDPTVPPPRRRLESKPIVPRVVREEEEIDVEVEPISSDPRELALRELKGVEERARERLTTAIAELAAAFERQITELQTEIADRDETIRRLQRADADALRDNQTLQETVAAMGRRMSAELTTSVTNEVKHQLQARAAAEGAEAGETAGRAAGSKAGAKWSPIAAFIGAVIAAAVSAGAQKCGADDDAPKTPTYNPRR